MKIAVVHGALAPDAGPDDRDALNEVAAVRRALSSLGHATAVTPVGTDEAAARRALLEADPDIAFNVTDSIEGRAELLTLAPQLLERLGIAYTGTSAASLARSTDRLEAKRVLVAGAIPTPPLRDLRWLDAVARGDAPFAGFIVKPATGSASLGIEDSSVISDPAQVQAALARYRTPLLEGEVFIESFVTGREFAVSMLEYDGDRLGTPEVLPPAEIIFRDYPADKPKIVGYAAKWTRGSFEFGHTPRSFRFPRRDARLLEQIREIASACWRVFDLGGYVRIDLRVDESGSPWVIDVNANPCLSPSAGFAAAVRHAGYDYAEAIGRIVATAKRHDRTTRAVGVGAQR